MSLSTMFPVSILTGFALASLLLAVSPGPDNVLTVSYGLSQGRKAAIVAALGCGCGAFCHVLASAFGLSVLLQQSMLAFTIVKLVGAAYLLYLGWRCLSSQGLVQLQAAAPKSLLRIWRTGFLSAALNPKPGFFILAFIPQFISPARGSVTLQMLGYGALFVLLAVVTFSLMGIFAAQLSSFLQRKPRVLRSINIGAGLVFVGTALSILTLRQGRV